MKRKFLKKGLALTALSAIGLASAGMIGADRVSAISLGDNLEISPVYQRYLNDVAAGRGSDWAIIPNKYIVTNKDNGGKGAEKTLPSSYSLINEGYGTTLKNQGTDGDCWAFALTTAIESNLKKNGITEEFSPKQMDYLLAGESPYYAFMKTLVSDFKRNVADGGNFIIGSYLLGGQYTPIKESVFFNTMKKNDSGLGAYKSWAQYNDIASIANAPAYTKTMNNDLLFSNKSEYLVTEYTGYTGDKDEVGAIKESVYENGAVWVGTYAPGAEHCWDADSKTIIDRGSILCDVKEGHAMAIIGWDDSHTYKDPRDNSTKTGAFLLQNSWGESDLFEKYNLTGDDIVEMLEEQGETLTAAEKNQIKLSVDNYDALEYVWLAYDFDDSNLTGSIDFGAIEEVRKNEYKNVYDLTNIDKTFTSNSSTSIEYKYKVAGDKEELIESIAVGYHVPVTPNPEEFIVSVDASGKGDGYKEVGRIPIADGEYGQKIIDLEEQVALNGDFTIKIEIKAGGGRLMAIPESYKPNFTAVAYTSGEMEVPNTSDPEDEDPKDDKKDKDDKEDKNDEDPKDDELKVPNTGIFGKNGLSAKIAGATIVVLTVIGIGVAVFKNRKHLFHKVGFDKK